jgi:predicted Zn-dependent protease
MKTAYPFSMLAGMLLVGCMTSEPPTVTESSPVKVEYDSIFADNVHDWVIKYPKREVFALAKSSYSTKASRWNKSTLTYRFNGAWSNEFKAIIITALNGIGSVIPLSFTQVSAATSSDLEFEQTTPAAINGKTGLTTSTAVSTNGGPSYFNHSFIQLATIGTSLSSRYNELLNVAMHEIGHAVGMNHTNIQTAMMSSSYTVLNGIPQLYFMAPDDMQGLQSIYGSAPPKLPSWDHRYTISFMLKVPITTAPGGPTFTWAQSSYNFPNWSDLRQGTFPNDFNTETYRLTIK